MSNELGQNMNVNRMDPLLRSQLTYMVASIEEMLSEVSMSPHQETRHAVAVHIDRILKETVDFTSCCFGRDYFLNSLTARFSQSRADQHAGASCFHQPDSTAISVPVHPQNFSWSNENQISFESPTVFQVSSHLTSFQEDTTATSGQNLKPRRTRVSRGRKHPKPVVKTNLPSLSKSPLVQPNEGDQSTSSPQKNSSCEEVFFDPNSLPSPSFFLSSPEFESMKDDVVRAVTDMDSFNFDSLLDDV